MLMLIMITLLVFVILAAISGLSLLIDKDAEQRDRLSG